MAPQKRVWQYRNEDEGIEFEHASSNLREDTQRKKVRLSNPSSAKSQHTRDQTPSSTSSEDDSDEEVQGPDADNHHGGPPATQYEMVRDGDFSHLKHSDLDDQRATQALLARTQQIGDNHAANNAIIQEITCFNFMCHERLHVELGPLINFVVGHNGSGKSAVLTAITLCLGGKAAATNRGASLKSLIKEGQNDALLVIKLKNEGADAYQPDTYGPTIIIERHFARTGTSGFRLKSSNGRLQSTKKGAVDEIVEYYQLQVDNPMNVLTQDAAKSFITASTPAQKYKFFKDGVQLQALDNDYQVVSDYCDQIEAQYNASKDAIEDLRKKAEVAKQRHDMVQEHQGMRDKMKEIGRQLAWAQVQDIEVLLAKREAALATAQENVDEAIRSAQDKAQSFQALEIALDKAKEDELNAREEMSPVIAEEDAAKEKYEATVNEVASNRTDRNLAKERLNEATQKVEQYIKETAAENKRILDSNGGVNAHKLAQIEEAKELAMGAKAAIDAHKATKTHLESEHNEAQLKLQRYESPLNNKRKEVENANQHLANLNTNRGNLMAGFDRNMSRLLQIIREEHKFREKPVGPMGMHIKLRDPKWSSVLESVLAGALTSFLVTSKADQVLLSSILTAQKMAHFCRVSIVNRAPIDTSNNEPDLQYPTVLKVLDIDNTLVRNYLIINNAIEQGILVEQRQKAMEVMFGGAKPRNVKFCLCLHDHRRGHGMQLGYAGANGRGQDMGPIAPTEKSPRMSTDIESQISLQRDVVAQLSGEKRDLEQAQRTAQVQLQRCKRSLEEHDREGKNLNITLQKCEEAVESLTIELADNQAKDGHLETLAGWLDEAKESLRIEEESYVSLRLEGESINARASDCKKVLKAVRDRLADHEAKLNKAERKIKRTEAARSLALRETNVAQDFIKVVTERQVEAKAERDELQELVINYTSQATIVCRVRVPIPQGETGQSLDAKYEKLKAKLEIVNKKMGATPEQIQDEYARAQQDFDRALLHRRRMEKDMLLLKQSFMKRMSMFKQFQRYISAASRINFIYLLSERAFRGKLTIDHKDKKLDVHVEPDETTKSGKGRTTKTLSGGEKSFSSICLLLSLWEAMGAPLRCLDEFDVFMDDVNRDVSTKMIISAARRSVGRQFILITPKALGAGVSEGAKDVRIIKLFDPRDTQRRIDDMMES